MPAQPLQANAVDGRGPSPGVGAPVVASGSEATSGTTTTLARAHLMVATQLSALATAMR
jgi:hypothetical protein